MSQFSQTLKSWRKARRLSQLDLALAADVSSRHISFLETGRSGPSPDMIRRLGDALEMPLSARNQMLTGAGYAPRHQARDWEADDMAPIRAAVDHMLTSHAPWPAIAVDRYWTMLRLNAPARVLFGQFGLAEGGSLLDLLMSETLPAVAENWPDVAHHAAHRLRTESAAHGGVPELDRVVEHLSRVPGASSEPPGPVVPTILNANGMRLSLFSTIAQFGTPEDLLLDDMKIELFFPADAESGAILKTFAENATEA